MNFLYYGDNLDVLRRHVPDRSVDLVYLDPPFKSNQDYNVLFAEKDGAAAAAGFYKSPWGSHPRLQILTVADLLDAKQIDYPRLANVTLKKAPKSKEPEPEQLNLAAASPARSRPKRRRA